MAVSIKTSRNIIRQHIVVELQVGLLLEFELDCVWDSRLHFVGGAIIVQRCIDLYVREKVSKICTVRNILLTQQGSGTLVRLVGAHGCFGFGWFGHHVSCIDLLARHGIRFLIELLRSSFFRQRCLGGTAFYLGFFHRGFLHRGLLRRGLLPRGLL